MREAVVVSAARTPIGKAYRGALNHTHGATLGAHAVAAAAERAGVDGAEVEDVIFGGSLSEGTTGLNVARQVALRAGFPPTVAGMTINRFCSSGLQSVALAAQLIRAGQNRIIVAGGLESISLVQNEHLNIYEVEDPWLQAHKPEIYMPMLQTAEVVAARYGVDREAQDTYALELRRRDRPDTDQQAFRGSRDRCRAFRGRDADGRRGQPS
jgi:acetyl-CoA C-acetyltransferase